jgi:predicted DNA-binding ArsR family transcriptional regulator
MFGKRKQYAEAQDAQRNRIILYKRVFGSPEGKEVLVDLMDRFYIVQEHDGSPGREGQRSVVLHIMRQAGMDLAAFDNLWRGEDQ